jgi:murein DD-endopeptidase MepM/ murein hydrolase activator NlpD
MQIMITHGSLATTRVLQINRLQIGLAAVALALLLMLFSGLVYHFVFLKAAREGWPVVSQIVRFVVRDEVAQRDRFVRENLDAFATKVGEMQAKLLKLEAMGERVSGMAGVKPEEFKPALAPRPGAAATQPAVATPSAARGQGGQGGPFIPSMSDNHRVALDSLNADMESMGALADQYTDVFTLVESRLLEGRLAQLMVPSTKPVDGPVGSGFGFRTDPFTGRGALHMGLDFPADVGTAIVAAAGGVVVNIENHHAYGQMVEIDHGGGLVTRYAHSSKILVKNGDLVRRGQTVALVGNSGRSTGPHLHFEVLVDRVPQNPARFLAGRGVPAQAAQAAQVAAATPALPAPETRAARRQKDRSAAKAAAASAAPTAPAGPAPAAPAAPAAEPANPPATASTGEAGG